MKFLAFLVFLVSFSATAFPTQEQLHKKIEEIRTNHFANAGMAIGVVGENGLIMSSSHGHQEFDTMTPVTENSLFMIGSTTKAFTSTIIGTLVEEEKMKWDQKVQSILPSFNLSNPAQAKEVSIRDLLSHMSGLPRHDWTWITRRYMTMEENLANLPNLELTAGVGEKWQYNNLMYTVAGIAAGKVIDGHWTDIGQNKILNPLGMNSTFFSTKDIEGLKNVAYPHTWNGRRFSPRKIINIDGIGPAGSIHSNVVDMAKWIQLNMNSGKFNGQQVVAKETIDEIHRGQVKIERGNWFPELTESHYGLAWTVAKYRGIKIVRHGGSINSYRTAVAFFPEKKLGIVILTSGGNLSPSLAMLTVADLILELDPIDWVNRYRDDSTPEPIPTKPGPEDLSPALGTFKNAGYGTMKTEVFTWEGTDYLRMKLNGVTVYTLPIWYSGDENVWEYNHAGNVAKLHLDSNKKVVRIEVNLEPRASRIIFDRVN